MKIGLHRTLAALLLAAVAGTGVAAAPVAGASAAAADDPSGYGRMILLLDSSGSMAEPAGGGQTKIAAAKSALRTVIDGLPDEAQVGLRVFGATVFSRNDKGACTDSQLAVAPGTDNRSELASAVEKYKPYGETPIPHALEQAAKDLGGEGPRSIVLVSDGESTCAPDPCKVSAQLQADGIDLQIDVVGLSVSGQARQQLQCIAENGNGHYYDADSAGDIESRLTRVAERAVRPFTLDGEPIEGGPVDAPTPVTVGDWVDRIGPGNDTRSYVFDRQTAGSTLRVSAVTQGQRIVADGLTIEIAGPDGTRCDYGLTTRILDVRDIVGVQATAGDTEGDGTTDGCAAPGQYVITVTRSRAGTKPVPFGLRVTEEPPVSDPGFVDPTGGDLEVTAPQAGGTAQPVEGGSSFANATEIGPGVWSSTVVPGEALLYRFPLDFGQSARISVTFPKASPGIAERFGRFPPLAQLMVYSPMRAQLGFPTGAEFSATPAGSTMLTATPAVSRVPFAGTLGKFDGGADFTASGDYYLGVSVQRQDYTVELPFTITVEITGEAGSGPTYADGATWTVADGASGGSGEAGSPSADPTDQPAEEPAAEEDSDDGSSTTAVTAGVVGVAGVAALAAALLLWRRRQA